MTREEYDNMPLSDLIDLLSKTTLELLESMNKRRIDPYLIQNKRQEVQMIQSVIERKKSVKITD